MAKKNTGKSYERLVQEVYQAILDYEKANAEESYKRVEVQHNVELQGKSGNVHQIDVYWSFTLGGMEYKTLVEVKDWKSPVKKEQLHSFISVLDDIPGAVKGCFVSKSGFQKGAEVVARYHGINLLKIEEENPSVRIAVNHFVTHYNGVELSIDEDWLRQEKLEDAELSQLFKGITQEEAILVNSEGVEVGLYDSICCDAKPYYYAKEGICHTIKKKLDGDWYCLTADVKIPKIKISEYGFECYNTKTVLNIEAIRKDLPQYIISDILDKRKIRYDPAKKGEQIKVCLEPVCEITFDDDQADAR